MRPVKAAFIAACIADISACSAIAPVDDYMTTHNLYGELCKQQIAEIEEQRVKLANDREDCAAAGTADDSSTGDFQDEESTKSKDNAL